MAHSKLSPILLALLCGLNLPLSASEHAAHDAGGGDEGGVMTQDSLDLITPSQAFERLQAGNQRFRDGKPEHHDYVSQRKATAHGQFPYATILSCMDSRASSEIIFDTGLGDIFNVRIAGNIVNDDVLGSLEYAHKVAGSKLLIVLGHSSCGAVKGAADDVVLGNLTGLVARIRPAVNAVPNDGTPRNSKNHPFIDKVARMNVIYTIRTLRERSPILRELQDRGKIDIIGAFYDLETGKVEFYRPLSGAKASKAKKAEPQHGAEPEEEATPAEHAKAPAESHGHEAHEEPAPKAEEHPSEEAAKEAPLAEEHAAPKPSHEAPAPSEEDPTAHLTEKLEEPAHASH